MMTTAIIAIFVIWYIVAKILYPKFSLRCLVGFHAGTWVEGESVVPVVNKKTKCWEQLVVTYQRRTCVRCGYKQYTQTCVKFGDL